MNSYRIEFESLAWESPMEGVRHKTFISAGKKLRLVEYYPTMTPHWCEKGHIGYILKGCLEIEFEGEKHLYNEGDGVFILDGKSHKHKARVLSEVVRAVFVEAA